MIEKNAGEIMIEGMFSCLKHFDDFVNGTDALKRSQLAGIRMALSLVAVSVDKAMERQDRNPILIICKSPEAPEPERPPTPKTENVAPTPSPSPFPCCSSSSSSSSSSSCSGSEPYWPRVSGPHRLSFEEVFAPRSVLSLPSSCPPGEGAPVRREPEDSVFSPTSETRSVDVLIAAMDAFQYETCRDYFYYCVDGYLGGRDREYMRTRMRRGCVMFSWCVLLGKSPKQSDRGGGIVSALRWGRHFLHQRMLDRGNVEPRYESLMRVADSLFPKLELMREAERCKRKRLKEAREEASRAKRVKKDAER